MKSFIICLSVILPILKIANCATTKHCLQKISLSYKWLIHPNKTLEMTCKVSDFNLPITILSSNKMYKGTCKRSGSILCKKNTTDEGLDIKMCNCSRFEVIFTIKGKLEHHLVGNWTCTYGNFKGVCDSKVEVKSVRTYKDASMPDEDDGTSALAITTAILSIGYIILIAACCYRKIHKRKETESKSDLNWTPGEKRYIQEEAQKLLNLLETPNPEQGGQTTEQQSRQTTEQQGGQNSEQQGGQNPEQQSGQTTEQQGGQNLEQMIDEN